ncbi:MAG: hypothetical protein HQL96_05370 [Magnetococcales bacterium]|nr:hypothetical protein [Magnetococcales bacterium]
MPLTLWGDKETARRRMTALPEVFKGLIEAGKKRLEDGGPAMLDGVGGAAGLLLKVFGQDYLDAYFDKLKAERLDGFGAQVYLQSALTQARKSLEKLSEHGQVVPSGNASLHTTPMLETLSRRVGEFTEKAPDWSMIFAPQRHPAVERGYGKLYFLELLFSHG